MRISLSFSLLLPFVLYIDLHAFKHIGTSTHGKIYIIAASQITQCFPAAPPEIGAENGVQLKTVQIDAYV